MKTPFHEINKEYFRLLLIDVQYALDGKWDRPSDLHYDTGIPMDDCEAILTSVHEFLNIDLGKKNDIRNQTQHRFTVQEPI